MTSLRTAADVVEACRKVGAPCSELNDISQTLSHPQVQSLEMLVDLPVEGAGDHQAVATPVTIDGARSALRRPPPALGEHSCEILTEIGYERQQIEELVRAGVVE